MSEATITPEGLRALTADDLFRQYRMAEASVPTGRGRNRLALAELEVHDAALALIKKEIERRMTSVGIFAVEDGQRTVFVRGQHGLMVRSLYAADRLDPLAEFDAVKGGVA